MFEHEVATRTARLTALADDLNYHLDEVHSHHVGESAPFIHVVLSCHPVLGTLPARFLNLAAESIADGRAIEFCHPRKN